MHDTNLLEDQPIAWTPTPDVIERAQLTKFMRQVGVSTWDELYEFSIRDVEKFTEEVLKFLEIQFVPPYSRLLDMSDGIEFPNWFVSGSKDVFPQSRKAAKKNAGTDVENARQKSEPGAVATGSLAGLNITTMCLDRWQTDEMKNQPAVVWEGEEGTTRVWTYWNLSIAVEEFANRLGELGILKGDAVGMHLPMLPETVIALLAINRTGAIAVPVFSGYGVEAIASRMNAVQAAAIITCDGFPRRGKWFDMNSVATEAIAKVPSIRLIVRMKRKASDVESEALLCGGISLDEDVERVDADARANAGLPRLYDWNATPYYNSLFFSNGLIPTSAEDPLIILYTSGTTGKPKGIAHTHASFPIKAAQDMAFGTDVGRGTRISWYTDIGWMMGPWLIYGALINGATICIYDGAPDYPTPDRMWEFCAKHKVEILGISPTLVRALAAHEESKTSSPPSEGGVAGLSSPPGLRRGADASSAGWSADGVVLSRSQHDDSRISTQENHPPAEAVPLLRKEGSLKAPHQRHDLSSLRIFASTGEPWNPAPWWWLFEKVGNSKLPIINYSGGTEIAGGILMGNPLLPIKPCSFPAPCPGMDVDILDEEGNPVGPNQVGELVIKQPWIGMARGFWQEKERYLETYWRRFKNIWVHGDWAMRDKDGHWFILGRSDDTLKVAGKRVGPAEVESLLVAHALVTEAAVIGVPDEAKGTAMVAFCVLQSSPPSEGGVAAASADGVVLSAATTKHTEDTERKDTERKELETELKILVAKDMGKPLAPSRIHFVSALPKTRNAKVMRRVLRSAYLGEDAGDLSALENPATLDEISAIRTRV